MEDWSRVSSAEGGRILLLATDLKWSRTSGPYRQKDPEGNPCEIYYTVKLDYLTLALMDVKVQHVKLHHEPKGYVKFLSFEGDEGFRGQVMGYRKT